MDIYQIAKRANVSRSTVSRVLTNNPSVSTKTRDAVLRVMEEVNYVPNAAARTLASKRSQIVGMLAYNITHPFWVSIFGGVDLHITQETEYGIFISNCKSQLNENDYKNNYKWNLKNLVARGVDGLIIALANAMDREDFDYLEASGTPYVIIQNQLDDHRAISVNVDNYSGAMTATRHLIQLGHKRILHAAGDFDNGIAEDRMQGFLQAMKESGLPSGDEVVEKCGFTYKDGYDLIKRLAAQGNLPTAVLFVNDSSAFGAYQAANELGISVPGELSVMGIDHLTASMDMASLLPDLTTMVQPISEMGVKAATLLMQQIAGQKVETFTYNMLLHQGSTTGRRDGD